MKNSSVLLEGFLIFIILSVVAFAQGYYIGGPFGIIFLAATYLASVTLTVILMQKYGIVFRKPKFVPHW